MGFTRTWWRGAEYHTDEMFVDFEKQGQGIGNMLLEHVKRECRTWSISNLVLMTRKGSGAEKFYMRNGFRGLDSMGLMMCPLSE